MLFKNIAVVMFMWDCKNYTFAFRRDSLTTIMKLFNEKKTTNNEKSRFCSEH